MLAEIGHFVLILTALVALVFPWAILYGTLKDKPLFVSLWRPALITVFCGLTFSFLALTVAFLTDDFSVTYVAQNSNTTLNFFYKIAAVWSGHEGSMLLWVWLISCWTFLFVMLSADIENLKPNAAAVSLAVIGLLGLFLIFTSNPFERTLPLYPSEGKDLNPILQDLGMIFHPPLLFLGYAGVAITFALSLACLLSEKLETRSLRLLTQASVTAWAFLTAGNILGSWWAYNELGWGGWWFWDPVENSSFIPWLLLSAQLHALALARRQEKFPRTVLFIPVIAFAVTLIGTFIVRSGVIQSVHAFATDPNRGTFLLAITCLLILGALFLFAKNAGKIHGCEADFNLYEVSLTFALFLLSAAAAVVLFGTVFPIVYQAGGLGSLSVGAPYFNSIFAPLTMVAAFFIGVFALIGKKTMIILGVALLSLGATVSVYLLQPANPWIGAGAAFTIAWLAVALVISAITARRFFNWFAFFAHLGIAVSMVGVLGDTQFEQEALVRMGPGYGRPLGDVIFVYEQTNRINERSFYADEAQIAVLDKDENEWMKLYPQRQTFKNNGMQMTAAGIHHGLFRDLYVSMGNRLGEDEYLMRLNIKPMVSWIWTGGLVMLFGVLFAPVMRRRKP